MPSYRPCMANNPAGTKLGAASMFPNSLISTGTETGRGSRRAPVGRCGRKPGLEGFGVQPLLPLAA
jgi:hypothetical protein